MKFAFDSGVLLTSLAAGLVWLAAPVASAQPLLASFDVTIPYGASQYSVATPPTMAGGLLVTAGQTVSCPVAPTVTLAALVSGQPGWVSLHQDAGGVFRWAGGQAGVVTAVSFSFQQLSYTEETCNFEVEGVGPGPGPGPVGPEQLAGVLQYGGGYLADATLTLPTPAFVRHFRIEVPAYCSGAAVLSAGTVTEGYFDAADGEGPGRFAVNHGNGQRIGAVRAALNGPYGLQCNLPVYVAN